MDNYTDICKYEYNSEYLSHNAQKKDFFGMCKQNLPKLEGVVQLVADPEPLKVGKIHPIKPNLWLF